MGVAMLTDVAKRLELFADQAKDIAILFLDVAGNVAYWSRGAERIFGWRSDEILGQPIALLFTPEDVANGLPALERAIAEHDGTSEDDRWMQRKDGSRFWASGAVVALRDEQRGLVGYGKMLRDRTEVREQIETLRNLLANAEAVNARKDVFLSTLSHELRNPLAPLLNATHLIRLSAFQPELEQPMRIIERQIDVLRRLIDDLLEVARINTGKIAMKTQRVSVHELLDEIARSMTPAIERKRQRLEVLMSAHAIVVDGDRNRLVQVIVNLVANASKFTPDGGTIWLKAVTEGDEAVVRVEDTGMGITPEMLPRIFDLFTQVQSAESHEGLGIGLAVVKDLVTRHGGTVQVESQGPGKGSEFTVRLPLVRDMAGEREN
jgi:PAS domain S-box-containing protein